MLIRPSSRRTRNGLPDVDPGSRIHSRCGDSHQYHVAGDKRSRTGSKRAVAVDINCFPQYRRNSSISTIGISVVVRNFSLVGPAGGQANAPGTGHIRYFIDTIPPSSSGPVPAPANNFDSSQKSYTWNNVNPGVHRFSVGLLNNDNTPLPTPAIATVQLTVIQGPPLGSGGGGRY
jgi:hypothetical protein